jgi:hypothetical protein
LKDPRELAQGTAGGGQDRVVSGRAVPPGGRESFTALQDAQGVADILLDAEAKLGAVLAEIEPKYVKEADTSFKGSFRSLPEGITHKESHQAQTIAAWPDVVEKVKARARAGGNPSSPNRVTGPPGTGTCRP